jgi:hypothetical protein
VDRGNLGLRCAPVLENLNNHPEPEQLNDSTMIELGLIVSHFAEALKAVDSLGPQGSSKSRQYLPGVGPLSEAEAIRLSFRYLRVQYSSLYGDAQPRPYPGERRICDLVLPSLWAIEMKLIRPFGDNGVEAEHWSENILHPYEGNVSSIGDGLKLMQSQFAERRALIVFGYEHAPPEIPLEPAVIGFELLTNHVAGLRLGPRESASFGSLIHPVHQQGKVFGWELLNT